MTAIFKKELKAYFTSPIGYVFLGFALIISGVFFLWGNIYNSYIDTENFFRNIGVVYLFLIPILTMRLLSEEKKTKTDQLLITSPVSMSGIVIGKFLASIALFAIALIIMCIYVIILCIYGDPDLFAIFTMMLGFLLRGCALISIGLFISSLTDNQIVSCMVTFAVFLMLWLLDMFSFPNEIIATIYGWLSVLKRYEEVITNGELDIATIVYFISFSSLFVFFTVMSLERKRWS
ncbi:MAG: ABC transporter permease subunit [Eubacteriales bacterium]|nr:ABC transporter permease subunit [Eubacteriales bacterium]